MNLIEGEIANGVFRSPNIDLGGLPTQHSGKVTLGFRSEDVDILPAGEMGNVSSSVYALELLGDATLIAVQAGRELINLKADKEYRAEIGSPVEARIRPGAWHLFDHASGARLD
jgi:multiple sugar transport system ATP-binding protein